VERITSKAGDTAQADPIAGPCDPHAELACVLAAVEVNRQARPGRFRDTTELIG
jgi:hypothetical protein